MNKRRTRRDTSLNVWPSFTDLITSIFIFAMFLLILTVVQNQETRQQLEKYREAAQEHGFSPDPDSVRDALRIAREYEDHISAGKGTEVPSCWVRDDESIEYIYDINLTPKGLIVRETGLPHRREERRALKLQNIVLNQDISEASFLSATSSLFEWSKSKKCRFFVRVFDSTGPNEKSIYQSRLKTVEAHFYKKLVSNEPF